MYDNKKHHRRSIRLPGYDYSSTGAYFITICSHGRECIFGKINEDVVDLSTEGGMLESWWRKIPVKFPLVQTDSYIIMPNHIHGVIFLHDNRTPGEPIVTGSAISLPKVVQWFKTMTANEYIRNMKRGAGSSDSPRLWQRNYYEHVIRNQESLDKIREYIKNNPYHWFDDEYHVKSGDQIIAVEDLGPPR